VLYYPLAALIGTALLAVISTGVSAMAFALLVCREWGPSARASSRAFATLWPAVIFAAAFPFALGAALALLSVAALQRGRTRAFAVFTALTLGASPLAFVILAVVSLGVAAGRRPGWARSFAPALVVGCVAGSQLVVMRLFPSSGVFPFSFVELVPALLFSVGGMALTRGVVRARALFGFFAIYGVVCILAFAIPSSLGSNIERVRYAAVPLALLALAMRTNRTRLLNVGVVVLAGFWNLTPALSALGRSSVDANASYWAPAVAFLDAHSSASYRVEVVDTADHWAAAYLPASGIPIARGWFRQDDFPQNEVLYDRRLARRAYLGWLRSVSVRYVLLTDAPTDYSARAEASLLRSGRSGLRVVRRLGPFTVYAVPRPRPIVTGSDAAKVLRFRESELVVAIAEPGRYHVSIRWSPYWYAARACIEQAPDGQMTVAVNARGKLDLRFAVSLQRGFEAFMGLAQKHRCGPTERRAAGLPRGSLTPLSAL
jgi:hypothetical protein